MAYQIAHRYEHYEVYIDGRFFCSADTYMEASRELESYLEEGR